MSRFNPSRVCKKSPLPEFLGMLFSASCALSCTLDADRGEPTASATEPLRIMTSTPGIGGLAVLYAGLPNPTNGSDVKLADIARDGVNSDTGIIGSIATGKSMPNGAEIETLVGYGDFNADGQTDLLFRTFLTGKLTLWIMQGHRPRRIIPSVNNFAPTFFSGPAKGHIGDINGDGISDIVWTGAVGSPFSWQYRRLTWIMQSESLQPASTSIVDSSTTELIALTNIDGDQQLSPQGDYIGHADLMLRNSRGDGMVWTKNGLTGAETMIFNVPASTGWVVRAVGDFNRDRYGDALWYNTTTGELSVWEGRSNGSMVSQGLLGTVPPSSGWTLVGTADVDSDPIGRTDIFWQHKASRVTSIWRVTNNYQVLYEAARPFQGESILGVMNMAEPPAPSGVIFWRPDSQGFVSIQVTNHFDGVVPNTIYVYANNQLILTRDAFNGINSWTIPQSQLPGGVNACVKAQARYHDRFSGFSQEVCGARPL